MSDQVAGIHSEGGSKENTKDWCSCSSVFWLEKVFSQFQIAEEDKHVKKQLAMCVIRMAAIKKEDSIEIDPVALTLSATSLTL